MYKRSIKANNARESGVILVKIKLKSPKRPIKFECGNKEVWMRESVDTFAYADDLVLLANEETTYESVWETSGNGRETKLRKFQSLSTWVSFHLK